MKKYILTMISLIVLGTGTIMTYAKGSGDDRSYGSQFGARGNRDTLRNELIQSLSHGTLSDLEKSDMEAIRTQLEKTASISMALFVSLYKEKTGKTLETTQMNSQTAVSDKFARPLYDLADSYSISLTDIVLDDSYNSQEINDLLRMSETETLNELNALQNAYENADDEDVQTTYLLLQSNAISKLRKISDVQLSHGMTPSTQSLETLNINTQNYSVKNYEDYPDGLKSYLEANNIDTQDLSLLDRKLYKMAFGYKGRKDFDDDMMDDFDDDHDERYEDSERDYRRDKKRNKR